MGLVLLFAALTWVGLVWWTIPPTEGYMVGPRAFPLGMGVALAALALLLLLQSSAGSAAPEEEPESSRPGELWTVVSVIGAILLYAALMERLGFLLTTVLIVAAVMIVILRIRNLIVVAGMAFGLSLGSYLIFAKLLGTYLPPGSWTGIYF